jgi:dihydropteroate synthase
MLLNGSLIDMSKPMVMGILNVTPDSFHDGGNYQMLDSIASRAKQMVFEGASIIDVGAYSTRPGAEIVTVDEELQRLLPALEVLKTVLPNFPISIDSFRSKVLQSVLSHFGPVIVNDISGGELDPDLLHLVADNRLPYICMHMRGTPQTMQEHCEYKHLINDIIDYFSFKIRAFRQVGITDIICDPGFGFSKTIDQNFELLAKLEYLKLLDVPIMVGVSRKSMIWKTLQIEPSQALNGTTALHIIALQKGATILRVHDVKEAVEAITLFEKV